jgi:hypothetical protein
MRWFGLAVVWMAVFVGACGGEPASEAASEEPAKVAEVANEKDQSSDATASVDCQLSQAEADLGMAGAEGLVAEWHAQEVEPHLEEDLSSALPEAKDLRAFLAERGYTC